MNTMRDITYYNLIATAIMVEMGIKLSLFVYVFRRGFLQLGRSAVTRYFFREDSLKKVIIFSRDCVSNE